MSIERELFEKEYCKVQMITDKGDTFEQYPNGDYVRHSLQLAWLMWQASANRQGYKLVPIKCTNNMAHAAKEVDGRLSAFKYGDVWEAMLGAVE